MTEKQFVSVSVPYEHDALDAAAKMLYTLAAKAGAAHPVAPSEDANRFDWTPEEEATATRVRSVEVTTPIDEVEKFVEGGDPAEVFGDTPPTLDATPATGTDQESDAATPPPPADPPAPDPTTDVDSDGIPWDGRIHSASKNTLKKTGKWKPKRGVDKGLLASVTAELKGLVPAGAAAAPAAAAPPAPPVPPAPDAAAPVTFVQLMQLVNSPGVGLPQANKIAQSQGFASVALSFQEPDRIPALYQAIKEAF